MLTSIAVNSINHVLQRHGWAKKRLQLFAGKVARIKTDPGLTVSFVVDEYGSVQKTDEITNADTTIFADFATLSKICFADEYLYRHLSVTGDHDFAAELIKIVQNIDLDFSQDLSHFIGDIPAHRITQISTELLNWHFRGLQNITQAVNEYLTEERPTLAKSVHIHQLSEKTRALSKQTEQLEQRLIQVTHKMLF